MENLPLTLINNIAFDTLHSNSEEVWMIFLLKFENTPTQVTHNTMDVLFISFLTFLSLRIISARDQVLFDKYFRF